MDMSVRDTDLISKYNIYTILAVGYGNLDLGMWLR